MRARFKGSAGIPLCVRHSLKNGPSQQRRSNITRLAGKVSEVDASVVSQFKFAADDAEARSGSGRLLLLV